MILIKLVKNKNKTIKEAYGKYYVTIALYRYQA